MEIIRVREYTHADLRPLKKITEHWYWPFFTDDHYKKFIAVSREKIVGVAVMSITFGTANLDFIYVIDSMRSTGVGRQLVRKIEIHARSKKAVGLGVNCGQENRNAQRFYLRKRFKKVGKVYNYFSNNNWQIFFWKKL